MDTPVCDFVRRYADSGAARLHMPGHKGRGPLGCEALDITEIAGADSLYEADGILAASEANAAALFGAARTLYGTEGSSQCIRAMLCLAAQAAPQGERPLILAARNVHRAFVTGAALLDLDVAWLWPEAPRRSLCSCPVSPAGLRRALAACPRRPAAVYLTSPDYLGGLQDIAALAPVCRAAGVPLLVDNAHGAYLHFLAPAAHPLDLGADLCCDSGHKTLPVLTGGAYLHIGRGAPPAFSAGARSAMALFGSTSPSYLILQSLDAANAALAGDYPARLAACAADCTAWRRAMAEKGWRFWGAEPLKLTIDAAASGQDGRALAARLRRAGVECETADRQFLVLMVSPANTAEDLARAAAALGCADAGNGAAVIPADEAGGPCGAAALPAMAPPRRALTIRQAMLAPHETLPAGACLGRVLAAPAAACPPAVPAVVSGEVLDADALAVFAACGIRTADVVR
jgi:arginine decarboxylase